MTISIERKTKKIVLIVSIFIVMLILNLHFGYKHSATAAKYRTTQVTTGNIDVTVTSTGIVGPENRLEIKAPIAGRVESVLVDEGHVVKKGQILAWLSTTERAAILDGARARGEAEFKRWDELYKPTPLMAPIAGTIISRSLEAGQTFTTQDSVFIMSDRLIVKAQVDETDIAQIKLQQKVNIVLDAYQKQGFIGKVDKISYDAKTVNNVTTYTVDIVPISIPDFARSGMTANVYFQVETKKNVQ